MIVCVFILRFKIDVAGERALISIDFSRESLSANVNLFRKSAADYMVVPAFADIISFLVGYETAAYRNGR